ncbi:MAG: fibronectin type III domain-containing protein [Candidatus Onthomorpha sp.]
MKKFLSLIVMAIAFAIQLPAQYVLTIGNENSTTNEYGPINSYYNNSYSQVIYLATELMPGEITAISYQYAVSNQLIDPNPVIYMAEVERSSFSSTSDWELNNLTEVYSGGSVTYSQGWVTISLTTPFNYSGNGNLLVAYNSPRNSYTSGLHFKQTETSDDMMIMNYYDDAPISITNPGADGYTNTYSRRPNTRFTFSVGEDFCYPPVSVVASNVLSDEATVSWRASDASTTTFGLDYKTSDEEDWTTASTSLTDTFYTLTGLTSLTDYDVKVYGICSNTNSSYTTVSFRTAHSQENCLPIPFTETFDDAENMTTWLTLSNTSNSWYIGTAENCSTDEEGNPLAGGSLYISNNNGTSAAYDNTATTYAYAYTYVSLQENTRYGLQFDWKGGNDYNISTIYDYIKVFLTPADYELPLADLPSIGVLTDRLGKETDWTRKGIVISDVQTGVYKLVFAWKNDGSAGDAAGCVDNVSLFYLDCSPVDSMRVAWTDEGESVSANLNIYSDNSEVSYTVEYRADADTQWETISGPSPLVIDDLLYGTKYFFRVTPVCSGSEYSVVSDQQFFYSPCTAVSFPYVQGFEDAFIAADGVTSNKETPLCWNNVNGGSSGYSFSRATSYAFSGQGDLYYSGSNSATTSGVFSDWLISPVLNLTGGEQLSYKIRLASSYYAAAPLPTIDVMICDVSETDIMSMSDTSRFTLVESINHSNLGTTYQEVVSLLSEHSGASRLAIAVRTNSQSFYLDDLTIETIPDCPPVYGLSASASSESSIAVSYSTANIGSAGVTLAYSDAAESSSFDAENATTIMVAQDEDLPFVISGLTPGATYYIAAKQSCEDGTYCEAVTVSLPAAVLELPYSENFDDTEAEHGFTLTGTGSNLWAIGTAQNNTTDDAGSLTEGGRALYISNDNGATAGYDEELTSYAYAKSPAISFGEGNSFSLSFDYKVGGESGWDYLDVYLLPYGEAVANNYRIASNQTGITSWQTFERALPASYANGIYQLVFYWKNDDMYSDYPFGAIIDNINIGTMSCGLVSSVAATLVEPEDQDEAPSITVDITDNNADLAGVTYVLKYKNSQDADYTIVSDLSAGDFPYSIEEVSYATTYTIAVASVCPDGEQTAFAQTSMVVPCAINSLPWTENFDTDPFSGVSCWSQKSGMLPSVGTVQTSSLSDGSRFNYHTATQSLRANVYGDSFHHWIISPSFDFGDGTTTYGLSFSARVTSYYGENAQNAPDDKFAVLISTDNGVSWNLANAIIYADGDLDTEHNYSDLFDTWTTQMIQLVDNQGNPLTGNVKFAFYGESTSYNGDNYLYIDNISISEWTDCLNPYSVEVTGVSTTTANVTFNEIGTATSWEYVVVEGANADPSTGAPVAFGSEDLPLQIEGLTPQTTYTLAIRSECSDSYSEWSDAVTFKTWATPETLPYTTDFENQQDNDSWYFTGDNGVNAWAIGSATFAGEGESGTSAYISNNGGTSYDATISWYGTYQYLWKDFDFGEGENTYTLSFDWKEAGYMDSDNYLSGGLAVIIQNLNDPMPVDGTSPAESNTIAVLYNGNTWATEQIELPQLTGEKRLAFYVWGYFDEPEAVAPAAIDNISITVTTCFAPHNVTVSNTTQTTAEVAWEGTSDSYIISYRLSSDTELTTVAVTSSPYTLTNLDIAKQYVVAVQGVCGSDESIYSDAVVFRTSCRTEAIDEFPFVEDFENGVDCWSVVNLVGSEPWTQSNGNNMETYLLPMDGGGQYFAETHGDIRNNANRFISPVFDLTSLSTPVVSFYHWQKSWGSDVDNLKVYYRTSEEGDWTQIADYQGNISTWTLDTIVLPNPSATYQLAFEANLNWGYGVAIDNVTIYEAGGGEQPQPCDAPTALAVNNITQTSADFTWAGTASSYEVRLNGGASETVTTTSKSFTGLTANTSYTAEVRAVCEESNSAWVSTTFTTLAEQGEVVAPSVATLAATSVTHNSAVLNGTITAGSEAITAQGFMYKATASADWTNVPATGTTLSATVSVLTAETEYQFKAFATTASGTVEGTTMTFTTTAAPVTQPVVTTLPATSVTHEVATLNGTVAAGTEAISAQGFMYKAVAAADWTTIAATGGTMSATITDLTAETAYEYKAFATTASGTVEGAVVNFTTLAAPATQPTVTTLDATEISHEAATLNGTIAAGTEAVTAQGFMYKSVLEAEWTTVEAAGTTITATINGLTAETQYEYKAFATTASGTVEGNVVLFTTLANSGLNSAEGTLATMTVYPNPASERATISVVGVESGAKIVVSDMQGRIILTDTMANDTYELSVDNLASGVYYIRVIDGASIHTQKLIVK